MNGLAFATLLALAAGLPPAAFPAEKEPSMANSEEQALFAGFYAQGYAHGNGSPVSVSSLPSSGFARFDLGTRALSALPDPMTPGYALENGLCSPDFPGYAFDDSPSSMYFDGQAQKPFEDAGPKSERLSHLCKVRAYYYDVPTPFGLAAVMYDQTGFLVGDSLLMTAAHGLCLDATSGMFDDGIENLHFPGKVEVYGAIGLADGWGSDYRHYAACTEMFMDAGFPAGRLINADWALLRLDSPLGRELSHRALYPECGPFDELSLSGYPGWGQKPATVSAEDGSILSSYGQLAYGADAEPGMSGAPRYDGRLHLDSVRQARDYDSAQRPILAARFAYGMHLRHDAEQGLGFGLRFTNSLCDFVSALNRRYRPDEIDALAAIEGADAGGLFALGPDHAAEIALINSSDQS